MLINHDSEYALGTETAKSMRILSGRRENFNPLQDLGISFAFAGPGILLYIAAMVFHLSGGLFITAIVLLLVGWALSRPFGWGRPASRRYHFNWCVEENRVLTSDDVLYRMLQMPITHKLVVTHPHADTEQYEKDVDAFIAAVAPYRDRENPEQSEFLTPAWEQEHGKVYELPSLLALGTAMGNVPGLQGSVRGIVTDLRRKRLAQLQQSQVELSESKARNYDELCYQQAAVFQQG